MVEVRLCIGALLAVPLCLCLLAVRRLSSCNAGSKRVALACLLALAEHEKQTLSQPHRLSSNQVGQERESAVGAV